MSEKPGSEAVRFDDLVRSERYFTATLLPAVLFHDGLRGLGAFLELVDRAGARRPDGATERDLEGRPTSRPNRASTWSADAVEVITEFHIYRDLVFAGRLRETSVSTGERERRDAPDLVVVLDDELVVCEGKFFVHFDPRKLDDQLRSQRAQLRHLLSLRPSITRYRHVALVPRAPAQGIDCDAVLTWDDIAALAARVLGDGHYVTQRLRNGAERYRALLSAEGVPYAGEPLPLDSVLKKCRERGDGIEVGHMNREPDLKARPIEYLKGKPWKWRDPSQHTGRVNERNWIPGSKFLELVGPRLNSYSEDAEGDG